MQSITRSYDPKWQRNQERGEAYWRRFAENSDSPLAGLLRHAYGWERHYDPRTNRRATKRYADKRQKKGKRK
jgi:hypothetical protein